MRPFFFFRPRPEHLAFGITILLSMSSTTGFFPPRTSPTCVRSLAGRLEQEADIAAAAGKNKLVRQEEQSVSSPSLLSALQMAAANPRQQDDDATTTVEINLRQSRDSIFRLAVLVGQASAHFLEDSDDNDDDDDAVSSVVAANNKTQTEQVLARILIALMNSATVMNVDLEKACHAKIDLNCKKYPVELCKVSFVP
jgi:hypothetical protein